MRLLLIGILVAFGVPTASAQEPDPGGSQRGSATQGSDVSSRTPWNGTVHFGPLIIDPEVRLDSDWRRSKPASSQDADNDLLLSGKRVGFDARLGKRFGFEISADLTSSTPWRNVRADYRLPAGVTVTAGQFKVPFSLDGARSALERDFVFRSRLADAFSMGRDRGVTLDTRFWRKRLTVDGGLFARDGDRTASDSGVTGGAGLTGVGRVTITPLSRRRGILKDLRIGVSGASSRLEARRSELTPRTVAGQELTPALYWAEGRRTRAGLDVRWRPGPVSLAAEYLRVADERHGQGNGNEDLAPLTGSGWFVEGTWLLTGEDKAKNQRPRRPLLAGGVGALELVGRVERASIGERGMVAAFAGSPRAPHAALSGVRVFTAGINWYPAAGARVQFNVVGETIDGATASSLRGISTVLTSAVRFQLFL